MLAKRDNGSEETQLRVEAEGTRSVKVLPRRIDGVIGARMTSARDSRSLGRSEWCKPWQTTI
jgi:hypothetical protein